MCWQPMKNLVCVHHTELQRYKQFKSYFLSAEGTARLELMSLPELEEIKRVGVLEYAHVALGVGSEEKVTELTRLLVDDGYTLVSGPRRTGDGYFESAIQDPDGNLVEITV